MEKYWSCGNYRTEIELTMEDAESVSHPGPCDDDVEALSKVPYVKEQLDAIDPEQLRLELSEYGAWGDDDLSDHDENLLRWLWLAGGQIVDEHFNSPTKDE